MGRLTKRFPGIATLLNKGGSWAIRLAAAAILLWIAGLKAGWLPDVGTNPFFFLGIVVALLLVLSELLMQGFSEVGSRLDKQEILVGNLLTSVSENSSLLNLDNVVKNIRDRLLTIDPLETVTVHHLGLDMTQAWEKVEYILTRLTNLRAIKYELIMIATDGDEQNSTNDDAQRLMISGRQFKPILERRARRLCSTLKAKGVELQFEVRTYCETPVMHGIAIRSPFRQSYVALCRWTTDSDPQYDWGGNEYHAISEPGATETQRDIVAIFEGFFHRYWTGSAPVPAQPAPSAHKGAGQAPT